MQQTNRSVDLMIALGTGFTTVLALPAAASEPGGVAAALVTEASYRHYLYDELYTHAGHDRHFGPEHDLARDNIAAIMTDLGLDVTLEPFDYLGETFYNVVGEKLGNKVLEVAALTKRFGDRTVIRDLSSSCRPARSSASSARTARARRRCSD